MSPEAGRFQAKIPLLRSPPSSVKEINIHPSLLSYLLPERRNFCLRLQPNITQKSSIVSSPPPFTLLNDGDPLAHTFRGAFVTDYGSIIKEVNLLIQRDTIEWPTDRETVLTNPIVDRYWQQAMTTRHIRAPEHSMLLATQVGGQQQLLAFASLFYCREKTVFFELPCPGCGQTLQLCKDDGLLYTAGLSSYTTSLRRYLFCPSCFQMNNRHIWYTVEREADDPSTVHDCRQLILEFGKLDPAMGPSTALPCLTCRRHNLCYGNQQAVFDAIFSLSFYPFYMLITECDSMDGFHLLTLIRQNLLLSSRVDEPCSDSLSMDIDQGTERKKNHDKAIHTIMQEVAEKWQQETPQNHLKDHHQPLHEILTPKEGISEEKQTLSVEDISLATTLPIGNSSTTEDLSQKTVLIGGSAEHLPGDKETLQTDTVLLSGNPTVNEHAHARPQTNDQPPENKTIIKDDDLTETVILRPGKKL